jgi:hypothetical protein
MIIITGDAYAMLFRDAYGMFAQGVGPLGLFCPEQTIHNISEQHCITSPRVITRLLELVFKVVRNIPNSHNTTCPRVGSEDPGILSQGSLREIRFHHDIRG